MKRIIYTAAALITCASVFGIADYLDAKKHGALVDYADDVKSPDALTPENKMQIPEVKDQLQTPGTIKETKREVLPGKKNSTKKFKTAHYAEIIPTLVIADRAKDPVFKKVDPIDILLSKTTIEMADTAVQPDNKRRISMEMFSRAPIRYKRKKN